MKNKRIVITGNIGSGKSTLTNLFSKYGYDIISADVVNREIIKEHQNIISKMFNISDMDFEDFKDNLRNIVFSDPIELDKLENFCIPEILKKINQLSIHFESTQTPFVIELPTLFESRGLQKFDEYFVINVIANSDTRASRIKKRNPKLNDSDIRQIMSIQIKPESKIPYCDISIENNSDYDSFEKKCLSVLSKFFN